MIEYLFSIMLLLLFVFCSTICAFGSNRKFLISDLELAFISASFIVKFPTSRKVVYEENVAKVQFHSFESFKGWPCLKIFSQVSDMLGVEKRRLIPVVTIFL